MKIYDSRFIDRRDGGGRSLRWGHGPRMPNQVTLLATAFIMGLFSLFGCSKTSDLDEAVCLQLKKAGSDLSKPHKIEFFLYFPTKPAAEQAAPQIRAAGCVVEVKPAAQGGDWLCFATKTMVPDLPALQKIRRDFNSLAVSLNGRYDGWGTEVEK